MGEKLSKLDIELLQKDHNIIIVATFAVTVTDTVTETTALVSSNLNSTSMENICTTYVLPIFGSLAAMLSLMVFATFIYIKCVKKKMLHPNVSS